MRRKKVEAETAESVVESPAQDIPAEEAIVPAKPRRSRKKAEPAAAEPVAEPLAEPVVDPVAAEASAPSEKPKRSRKKKADAPAESAETLVDAAEALSEQPVADASADEKPVEAETAGDGSSSPRRGWWQRTFGE